MKSPLKWLKKALAEWGKPEGELAYLKRAPAPLYERWKKAGGTAQEYRPGIVRRSCTVPPWGLTRITKILSSSAHGAP